MIQDFESWDDSDWGWKDEETDDVKEAEQESLSWMQDCHISLSPAGELMALANDDRLVLLSRMLFWFCFFSENTQAHSSYSHRVLVVTLLKNQPC